MNERRFGILIASSRFPDEPKLEDLRFPENDVDGLNELLVSQNQGHFTQTIVLKNQLHYEILLKINQVLRKADKNDLVLIYYSGHGKLNPAGKLHLTSTNTVINALEATSIPVSTIKNYVDISSSNKIVLILDCCFSGAAGEAFARGGVDDQLQLVSGGRGTCIMTASTGIQVAQEKESDQYGVFTKHLIEGIKSGEADLDSDGRITMADLYRYVHDKVLDEGFQEPMKWDLNVRGELVIAHSGKTPLGERRKQIREILFDLAKKDFLPDDIFDKTRQVNALNPDQFSEEDRNYDRLLDQLLNKSLEPVEFIRKWDRVGRRQEEEKERREDEQRKVKEEWQRLEVEKQRLAEQKSKLEEEQKRKEAARKAEEERKREEAEREKKAEAERRAEEDRKQKEAKRKAEEDKRLKEQEEKERQAAEEKRRKEQELRQKAKEESKKKEAEAERKEEEERKRKEVEREKKSQVEIKDDPPKPASTATITTEAAKDEVKLAEPKLSEQKSSFEKPVEKNRAIMIGILIASFLVIVVGGILLFRQDDTKLKTEVSSPPVKQDQKVENKPNKTSSPQKLTDKIGMKFVLIPAGKFVMGSPPDEQERETDERQHEVNISKPFYLQTTEVSQGQWKTVMGTNPSSFENCGDDCPIESISWNDAQEFISKLNQMEGTNKYRLPTEAEWEYACRAETTTPFYTGDCISTDQANYLGIFPAKNCPDGQIRGKTVKVVSFQPNAWGLHDMHGNVWEWCQDRYGDYPSNPVVDPKGPNKGESRVMRGGGWNNKAMYIRSASRSKKNPDYSHMIIGFRVAQDF